MNAESHNFESFYEFTIFLILLFDSMALTKLSHLRQWTLRFAFENFQ